MNIRDRRTRSTRHRRTRLRNLFRTGSSFRPTLERLEDRLVLTTPAVVAVAPVANSFSTVDPNEISATFSQSIAPNSVSDQTFVIYGTQSGQLRRPTR